MREGLTGRPMARGCILGRCMADLSARGYTGGLEPELLE